MFILPIAILLIIFYLIIRNFKNLWMLVRARLICFRLPEPPNADLVLGHLNDVVKGGDHVFKRIRVWNMKDELIPVYLLRVCTYFTINIMTPDLLELILSPMKHLEKSDLYKYMDLWLGKGLLTSYGELWQTRRKILTPAFHFSILREFLKTFINESDLMVEQIKKENLDEPIDVVPFVGEMTLRAINDTAMGYKFDKNVKEGTHYKDNVFKVGELIRNRFLKPWYNSNWIYYNIFKDGHETKKTLKELHQFTDNIITKRSTDFKVFGVTDDSINNFEFQKKKLAMLDLLLNEKFKHQSIDNKGIRDEVDTFMFEGHDTTAVSLSFTLMLIACHKEIQNEMYEEILQILGPDKNKEPTYNELQQLSLMERCIKESLRLYPSVPFIGRVISEDIKTSFGILPKGIPVALHIFDAHRNPKHWPNPEKFDPSRFLPENCKGRHPYAYIPFSAGPRNCIGQRFATLEIKTALCAVLRNFILEPVDTPETIELTQDLVLRSKNGVKVKFSLR